MAEVLGKRNFDQATVDDNNVLTTANNIADLNNVSGSPSTDDVLTWNGSAWVPQAASGGSKSYYDVYDNVGGQTFTTGTITLNLDTARADSGASAFSLSADEVTVNNAGVYKIDFRVTTDVNTGTARSGARGWLEKNSVEVDGTRVFTYARSDIAGEDTAHCSLILTLSASDVLRIRVLREHGTDTMTTVADASGMTITEL